MYTIHEEKSGEKEKGPGVSAHQLLSVRKGSSGRKNKVLIVLSGVRVELTELYFS